MYLATKDKMYFQQLYMALQAKEHEAKALFMQYNAGKINRISTE